MLLLLAPSFASVHTRKYHAHLILLGISSLRKSLIGTGALLATQAALKICLPGEQWGYDVTISHTNYISRQVGFYHGDDDIVLLKKLGEPSEPHPWLIFNGSGEILKDMGAGKT